MRDPGSAINRHPGYERVYLTLYKVADTPFHIQGDDIYPGRILTATILRDDKIM